MKVIDFYGRTIKIEDISFCEKRKSRLFSFLGNIGNIFSFIIFIVLIFFLYKSGLSENNIKIVVFVFIIIIGIAYVFDFIFGKPIVEITLSNGNKIKSPKLSEDEASALQQRISMAIEGKL